MSDIPADLAAALAQRYSHPALADRLAVLARELVPRRPALRTPERKLLG